MLMAISIGWIPISRAKELYWLKEDLASTSDPVVVFVHQRLEGTGGHTVKNATQVRQILQESKRVLAVFQGHYHAGHYSHLDGIHYYTLKSVVDGSGAENNSYAIVEVLDDYSLVVTGYRRAEDRKLVKA